MRDFPQDHLEAVAAIPELLKNASLELTRPDREGNPDIKAIHIFRQPVRIGPIAYSVKFTVKERSTASFSTTIP
jgi:hypothetical protein